MKNIIIAGIPRSGKTTLAKKLFFNLKGYNFVQEDVLCTVISEMYTKFLSEKKVINEYTEEYTINRRELNEIEDFILRNFIERATIFEPNIGNIIETYTMTMEELAEYQAKGFIVIILGYADITTKELLQNIRRYDTPEDRTYYLGSYLLMREISNYTELSKDYRKKCEELGLTYIDTSYNRKENLEKAYQIIIEKLENSKKTIES